MKRKIVVLVFLLTGLFGYAQKDTQTVATVNGEKISVAEFKKVYEKNLEAIDNEEGKDVANNLELYINFKLKVTEAYKLRLDTLRSFKREIETYRNQLIAPYLQDKEYLEQLVREAYDRSKNEVKASHILFRLPKNFTPEDTLKVYNKALAAREKILKGEPFDKMAKALSEDPSAKTNGGDLGYFSAFKMIYDFENVAYTIKEEEVSLPFQTRFGYHILKKVAERPSKGEIQVAHILLNDTTAKGKTRIYEAYDKLKKGEKFPDVVKEYSNDRTSKNNGGLIRKFRGDSDFPPEPFRNASFALQKENEFSEPFETSFGWHIVQLKKKFPVLSFEEMEKEIRDRVNRSGRARLSDQVVLDRLKAKYTVDEFPSTQEFIKNKNIRSLDIDSLKEPFIKVNEKILKQADFARYIKNRRHLPNGVLFQNFVDQEILTYYKENLTKTEPEFASTLKEYEDGLLLFELMQRKVWDKSKDSVGLQNYFDKNKTKYETSDLTKIRGKVMNDYQNAIEASWIQSLRENSTIDIDKRVLKKLTKYYRKES